MQLRIFVEGQDGITWERWVEIAQLCETLGFDGLFRSDHVTSVVNGEERDCLEAWTVLAGLAAVTTRLRLGTLVSPATYRHPSMLAKEFATVDAISGGRAELGLGAGWHKGEHAALGIPFPAMTDRVAMLAEQLEIVRAQWTGEPTAFAGRHYNLDGIAVRPVPIAQPHPRIIIGGSGGHTTALLAARWADEYNLPYVSVADAHRHRATIAAACDEVGRDPATLRITLMTAFVLGPDSAIREQRAARSLRWKNETGDARAFLEANDDTWLIGDADTILARLADYGEAGIEGVYLQHLDHPDDEVLHELAAELLPRS